MTAVAYSMTINDLCRLAYDYALHLKKTLPPSKKTADECWAGGFRKRNNFSLRTPENTSIARATAFNSANVKTFHNILYTECSFKHQFGPMDAWNGDQDFQSSLIDWNVTSWRNCVQRTRRACDGLRLYAADRVLAPVLIFPRKRVQPHWANETPPGSLIMAYESG